MSPAAARLAADAVLLLHAGFVAFVVLGALPGWRWRWWPLVHLPALAWGVGIELTGGICPLTRLENHWLQQAGGGAYAGSFIERHLWPLIYPDGLTRTTQWALATLLLGFNAAVYAALWRRWAR